MVDDDRPDVEGAQPVGFSPPAYGVARRTESPTLTGMLVDWWRPPAPLIRAGKLERRDTLGLLWVALENEQLEPEKYEARVAAAETVPYRADLYELLADVVEPAYIPANLRPPERPPIVVGNWRLWSAFTLLAVSGVAVAVAVDKSRTNAELADLVREGREEKQQIREDFGREIDELQQQVGQLSERLNRTEQDTSELRQRVRDLERRRDGPRVTAPFSPADPTLPGGLDHLGIDGAAGILPGTAPHGARVGSPGVRTPSVPAVRSATGSARTR